MLDLWSLFRNRFDVDIQTIFSQKDKGKKKIFKDINYANFFKNDLIDYKNLKKYVNFLFISTNLLYRGINCMGFTTIINYDMPFGNKKKKKKKININVYIYIYIIYIYIYIYMFACLC